MKRFLYIFLMFLLTLAGALTSCKSNNDTDVIEEVTSSPTSTPQPIIEEISKSPVTFIFLESEGTTYNSLYHQLTYLKMENLGYTINNVYVKEDDNLQSVLSNLETNGTEYVVVTSGSLREQVVQYQQNSNSNMVFIQHDDYYLNTLLSYEIKLYEYYYLAGVALCSESQSKIAGFIADNPSEQTIRCINAFALGMKSVDADSVVIVSWTLATDDENNISQLIDSLSLQKCDVFAYFIPGDLVDKVSGNLGLNYMSMSAYTAINTDDKMSIKPIISLDTYYGNIMNMDKSSLQYSFSYLGIQSQTVSYELSSSVSDNTQTFVLSAYDNIINGFEVFSGPLYNEVGLVVPEGTSLPEQDILDMLWFVDNVVGDLPAG